MPPLETLFQKYQIHSLDECDSKNFAQICKQCEYDFLWKWFFSRAFRIRDTEWVIKEWRWDIDIPLIFGTKNIHGQPLQKLLSPFSYKFLPTKEEAWRQYQEYLLLVRYFWFFDDAYEYYPDYEAITHFQNGLRWNIEIFWNILHARFDINMLEIDDNFPRFHNFLPREYMGYGASISKENKNKKTSYIAQEFIRWVPFSEKKIEDLSKEELKQVYLLCILILICYVQTGKIPDTRPTSDPKHWGQWFLHTENIFVTESQGIKMVDTRWLWDVDGNIIKRGIMIPELILQSVIRATKKIGKILS